MICLLKGIVKDQIKEATSMGISAGSLSNCLQTCVNGNKPGRHKICISLKKIRLENHIKFIIGNHRTCLIDTVATCFWILSNLTLNFCQKDSCLQCLEPLHTLLNVLL